MVKDTRVSGLHGSLHVRWEVFTRDYASVSRESRTPPFFGSREDASVFPAEERPFVALSFSSVLLKICLCTQKSEPGSCSLKPDDRHSYPGLCTSSGLTKAIMVEQQTHPQPVASQSRSLYEDDTAELDSLEPDPSISGSQPQLEDIPAFPEHHEGSGDDFTEGLDDEQTNLEVPIMANSQQLPAKKPSESQLETLNQRNTQRDAPQSPNSQASHSGQEVDEQEETEQLRSPEQTEEIMADADVEPLLQQTDIGTETPTKQGRRTFLAQELMQRVDDQPRDSDTRTYARRNELKQSQPNTQPTPRPSEEREAPQNFQDNRQNRRRQANEASSASLIPRKSKRPHSALTAFDGTEMAPPPKPSARKEPLQRGTSNAEPIVVDDEASEDGREDSVEGEQQHEDVQENHKRGNDPEDELAPFNWKSLYDRFDAAMEAKEKEERELQDRYKKLVQVSSPCLSLFMFRSCILFAY